MHPLVRKVPASHAQPLPTACDRYGTSGQSEGVTAAATRHAHSHIRAYADATGILVTPITSAFMLAQVLLVGALVCARALDMGDYDCAAYHTSQYTLWGGAAPVSDCACPWGEYNSTDAEVCSSLPKSSLVPPLRTLCVTFCGTMTSYGPLRKQGCQACAPLSTGYTWLPTSINGDDPSVCNDIATCAEGYYNVPWPSHPLNCQPCPTSATPPICADGYAVPRCNATACSPCNTPDLSAHPTWRYAQSVAIPSCSVAPTVPCVAYQTPDWSALICQVRCVAGYTDVSRGQNPLAPQCSRCVTDCVPGTYVPECPAQGTPPPCGTCPPLPPHTVYISGTHHLSHTSRIPGGLL